MSDYVYEEQQVGELTVKVYQDEYDDMNPLTEYRPEWLEIIHWHRRNNWGGMTNVSQWDNNDIAEYAEGRVAYPLYLYEHGQCAFSMSTEVLVCQWDSGQVGFVLIDKAAFMKEWEWKRLTTSRQREMFRVVSTYIDEFDKWQRGEVYGYVVEDADGENLDSCWGFIGDTDYCLKEGVAVAESIWADKLAERAAIALELDEEFEELSVGQSGDALLGAMRPIDYKERFYDNNS